MADERTTPGTTVALTIAGSDSSGGAGIQADLKTFAALGVYGASAITAITAQNTTGVKRSLVLDPELVEAQIDAVAGDFRAHATKTGMLANAAVIRIVAAAIDRHNLHPLVVDPVMVARGGDRLIDDDAIAVLCRKLLPLAAVVTPNRHEAARLLGQTAAIDAAGPAIQAARAICSRYGARACVVKGIRRPVVGRPAEGSEAEAVDIFFDGHDAHELVADWRDTDNTHGSGCTFSAALCAALALGRPVNDAVVTAKAFVSEAIRRTTSLGHGHAPVNHLAYLQVKR